MKHEHIKEKVHGLLANLGFVEKEIVVTHDEGSNTIWFSVTSPGTRLLLTREAEALTALNHLVAKIVERTVRTEDGQDHPRVVVDANDFEKKKIDGLKTIAHMMAERARYFKASVDIDPMNAHERRIIHEFISAMPDVKTESVGEGVKRHVVIKYVGGI